MERGSAGIDVFFEPEFADGLHEIRGTVTNEFQKTTRFQRVFAVSNSICSGFGAISPPAQPTGVSSSSGVSLKSLSHVELGESASSSITAGFALEYPTSSGVSLVMKTDWSSAMLYLNPLICLIILLFFWGFHRLAVWLLQRQAAVHLADAPVFARSAFFATDRKLKLALLEKALSGVPTALRWALSRVLLVCSDEWIAFGAIASLLCRCFLPRFYRDEKVGVEKRVEAGRSVRVRRVGVRRSSHAGVLAVYGQLCLRRGVLLRDVGSVCGVFGSLRRALGGQIASLHARELSAAQHGRVDVLEVLRVDAAPSPASLSALAGLPAAPAERFGELRAALRADAPRKVSGFECLIKHAQLKKRTALATALRTSVRPFLGTSAANPNPRRTSIRFAIETPLGTTIGTTIGTIFGTTITTVGTATQALAIRFAFFCFACLVRFVCRAFLLRLPRCFAARRRRCRRRVGSHQFLHQPLRPRTQFLRFHDQLVEATHAVFPHILGQTRQRALAQGVS